MQNDETITCKMKDEFRIILNNNNWWESIYPGNVW